MLRPVGFLAAVQFTAEQYLSFLELSLFLEKFSQAINRLERLGMLPPKVFLAALQLPAE
ncbi:MAG: hypothetical protein RLZZ245_662 [Verrucomicrobiota bacterium]